MNSAILAVLGAAFTVAVSLSAGRLLLRLLALRLTALEGAVLAFTCGSALTSTIVFLITALGFAYPLAFIIVGSLLIALAFLPKYTLQPHVQVQPGLPKSWRYLFGGIYTCFAVLYFINALAPEHSPDGIVYHVALVAAYLREHRFPRITTDMYAALSQGMEMLFLLAFSIGKHSATALVHLAFLLSLPLTMLSWGRRFGHPVAGAAAGLLVFVSPVVGRTGTVAYVDVALAAILFSLFYVTEVWRDNGNPRLLVLIGLLAGFAFSVKYTAFTALVYAMGVVALKAYRQGTPMLRQLLVVTGCALAMIAPWLAKNSIILGNPVAPFANDLFPNPYFYSSTVEYYSRTMRSFNEVTYAEIPLEVTIHGERLLGFLGPIFLLAPLAVVALRDRAGRSAAIAALLFGSTYFANIGTRFLIPALPFVALCMSLALGRCCKFRALAVAVAAHAFLSWPPVTGIYASEYAWRIAGAPWRAALRIVPEAEYLQAQLGDYALGSLLEKHVAPDDPVFSVISTQKAYHTRDVIVGYQSAKGNRLRDALWAPVFRHLQPVWQYEFRFLPIEARRVRIRQTGDSAVNREEWMISEIKAYYRGAAVKMQNGVQITASPNPWDAHFAIDGNPITKWRSGRVLSADMFVEIDFGPAVVIDQLVLDCPPDQWGAALRLEYDAPGRDWVAIMSEPARQEIPPPPSIRQLAADAFKREGVHWILTGPEDRAAEDLADHEGEWGLELAGSAGDYRLYRAQ